MSIKLFGIVLIALIGFSQAIPLLLRSESLTESVASAPAETQEDAGNTEWNTAAFANLDRQLRSDELVPLSRRMREILNYASRVDESALDSDSESTTTSTSSPSDSESSEEANVRVKKSFNYYPARG
uniref:Uncharacterized protein n=1 Tax=Panagrolaimus sp. PS1159 TaxID=55785 RepID=A0AC35GSC2_9BILA